MSMSRFRPDFRSEEVKLIVRFGRGGASSAFLGISGIGKSNLLNYFARSEWRQ